LSCLALILTGCALAPSQPGEVSQPIIGGVADNGDPSIVLVLGENNQGESICTGEVVSPHVVLTAAHCVDPATVGNGVTFYIFKGSDLNNNAQANNQANFVTVKETHYDTKFSPNNLGGGHDVGVVITTSDIGVPSLPMNHNAITNNDVGQNLRVVGYGVNSGNDVNGTSAGTKRQVTMPLQDYDNLFLYFGNAKTNTCEGDSGGPALLTINGVETIVGITSFGDQACAQGGADTRVDVYAAAFVDPYIATNDPNMGMMNNPPPDMEMQQQQPQPDLAMGNNNNNNPPVDAGVPHTNKGGDMAIPAGALGSTCKTDDNCNSHLCALTGSAGFCTQACDPNTIQPCPDNFFCSAVGSDHICEPANEERAVTSGCSVGGSARPHYLIGALLLLALALVRRRISSRSR
jgi:MYXO-CTERM domain-containing protein